MNCCVIVIMLIWTCIFCPTTGLFLQIFPELYSSWSGYKFALLWFVLKIISIISLYVGLAIAVLYQYQYHCMSGWVISWFHQCFILRQNDFNLVSSTHAKVGHRKLCFKLLVHKFKIEVLTHVESKNLKLRLCKCFAKADSFSSRKW